MTPGRYGDARRRRIGLLGGSFNPAHAGHRHVARQALRALRLDEVHSHGYGFQVDMLWHAHQAGLRIVEVPITFVERSEGQSKMTGSIVVEAMLRVTAWGIADLPARVRRGWRARRPEARQH